MDRGESIHMSTTFAKEEMIQASKFRSLSQRNLQNLLHSSEKIGLLFPTAGLDGVMLSFKRYEAIVNRLNELEEVIENIELERKFGYRFNSYEEDWVEHPEGMSTLEMYRHRKERADS